MRVQWIRHQRKLENTNKVKHFMWGFSPLSSYYHFAAICFVTVSYVFANIKINSWIIFKNLTWFKTISTFLNKSSDNQKFQMKQKNMQCFSGQTKCYDPALQFSKCFMAESKCSYLWLTLIAGTSNIYQAVHSSVNAFKHIRVVGFYISLHFLGYQLITLTLLWNCIHFRGALH